MQLGMIGLGRMGASLVRRLTKDGRKCVVCDVSLAVVKKILTDRLTTAFSLQGHYVLDPHNLSAYPPADLAIERIGDLIDCNFPFCSRLLGPAIGNSIENRR